MARRVCADVMLRDHDANLYAKECGDGTVIFWFRHWTWNRNETAICQITSRDEAVRFIREQFKPGLFSGWNHNGLARFLPEVYGKEGGGLGFRPTLYRMN